MGGVLTTQPLEVLTLVAEHNSLISWLKRALGYVFAEEDTADVTLQGSTICGGSPDSVSEDPELDPFARVAGSGSKSCNSMRNDGCAQVSAVFRNHSGRCPDDIWLRSRASRVFPRFFRPFGWSNFARTESPGCGSEAVALLVSCPSNDGMQFWIAHPFWWYNCFMA